MNFDLQPKSSNIAQFIEMNQTKGEMLVKP